MSQVVKTLDNDPDLNSQKATLSQSENSDLVLRNATSEDTKPKKLRNATAKQDPIQELLQRVTAAYTETEVQGMSLEHEFRIVTRADNDNPDIVEVPLELLGFDAEVRELDYGYVQDLALTNERRWPALEVCLWPEYLPKLDPVILLRIISGNHRTAAAREKGLSSLPVRIFKVENEMDFRTLAVYSNASHGLRFKEDECKKQAAYFYQGGKGKSYDEIALIFGKSKSTISRWITGNDSNASRKIAKIVQPEQVSSSSSTSSTLKTPVRAIPTIVQKIEALLIGEGMSVSAQEAKMHIDAISAQKKQRLHALYVWLQEVMEG